MSELTSVPLVYGKRWDWTLLLRIKFQEYLDLSLHSYSPLLPFPSYLLSTAFFFFSPLSPVLARCHFSLFVQFFVPLYLNSSYSVKFKFNLLKMFVKISTIVLCAAAVITGVTSSPLLTRSSDLAARNSRNSPPQSFNNYHGLASMANFDNFYGADNFDGSKNAQTVVVNVKEVVCHTQAVEIIQQRLLVLQEMAKKIITETICDVETQTIVFEQHVSGLSHFGKDMRRKSKKQVGYDQSISSHFKNVMDSNGTVTTYNLNFTGADAGKNTVVPSGDNWNNSTSPASVGAAYNASMDAIKAMH